MSQPLPPLKHYQMPFYYSSLYVVWCYYEVDADVALPFFDNPTFEPVIWNGKAIVNFNYQNYASVFPAVGFNGYVNELELNILAYPKELKHLVPTEKYDQTAEKMTPFVLEDYLRGKDVSRLIGNYRVKVPADSPVAILAGKTSFGEPKFASVFTATVPALNPMVPATSDKDFNTWKFSISAPVDYEKHPAPENGAWAPGDKLVDCEIDLCGKTGFPADPSPTSYYGQPDATFDVDPGSKCPPDKNLYYKIPAYDPKRASIGARWNILLTPTTILQPPSGTVTLTLTEHPYQGLVDAFSTLVGTRDAVAVQTFVPPPAAIESAAYYIQPATSDGGLG